MAATDTALFTRYSITSSSGSNVQGITIARDGNPWFATGSGTIGRLDQHTGKLKVYNLTNLNAGVSYVKFDHEGNIWFPEYNVPAIGEINPMSGKERDFVISPPNGGNEGPTFVQIDGHDNVWFSDTDFSLATGGFIGRLSQDGDMSLWPVPTIGARLEEIGLDHRGPLWFAEQGTNKVGRLDPSNNTITQYTSPTPNSDPAGILVAPDTTIWYSEHAADKIAHLFPNKAPAVTTHVTPIHSHVGASVSSRSGAPGASTNPTRRTEPITTVTSMVTVSQGIVEYSLPPSGKSPNIEDMRFDRQGNIFFEDDVGRIGELVLHDGSKPVVNEWPIPDGKGYYTIEFGASDTLWISDLVGNAVYKFEE
jgi:virginiamycin B lyase